MISSSWNGSQIFYAYDSLGNRTRMSTPSGTSFYSYDQETGRRLLSVSTPSGTFTFSYDQNGNLIQKATPSGTWNFSYDPFNRLKEVKLNGVTVGNYSYNGMGKRVSKVAGTVNSTYLWDGENLAQETRGGTSYLYSYLGMNPISLTSGGSSQVLETDLLGSILGVVNSSGVEIARYITDDFGNLQNQSGNSPNPFLFAGSFFDCESGLYQMRGRYYDPLMGRFLTQDFGPGNPYSYCKNNQVSMVDPSGWMYMYRAAVLGGDQGTWRDALAYLINLDPDNPAVIIGYGYILGQTTISKLLDLTNTLVSPYVEVRQKILTAALFFLRMEAEGIFPYEDETNCCANFVSLVLRMAGIFRKNENYKYIGKLNDVNGLQGALYHKHGYIHSSDPKGPGDIIIFYKDYSDAYHHVGIYLGEGLYIGSNNYPGEEDPQWININPIWQMAENWYWW